MTEKVHNITDVKKSWKDRLPSKEKLAKYTAIAVFGTAVALVGYDKLVNRHQDSDTEDTETD